MAINTLGTVAVQVRDNALGINMLVTKRGADDAPRVIADTERVADFPTFCDNGITRIPSDPSINEKGEVAFQGGPLATIAHTINQPVFAGPDPVADKVL